MLEFLPEELRAGIALARKRAQRRGSRLHLRVGERVLPVLRLWQGGFAIDAGVDPQELRGLVDLYDGLRHLMQCLIFASEIEEGELVCEFKRATLVEEQPAVDYWRGENAPVGYLPRN